MKSLDPRTFLHTRCPFLTENHQASRVPGRQQARGGGVQDWARGIKSPQTRRILAKRQIVGKRFSKMFHPRHRISVKSDVEVWTYMCRPKKQCRKQNQFLQVYANTTLAAQSHQTMCVANHFAHMCNPTMTSHSFSTASNPAFFTGANTACAKRGVSVLSEKTYPETSAFRILVCLELDSGFKC